MPSKLGELKACFYDICGGAGRAVAALRKLGFRSKIVNARYGALHGITNKSLSDLRQGRVLGRMLAPPCNTFSIAMKLFHMLRSRECPEGVAGLAPRFQSEVDLGNAFANAVLELLGSPDDLTRMRVRCHGRGPSPQQQRLHV